MIFVFSFSMRSVVPLRLRMLSCCWPRPNSASLVGELNVVATVLVATPSTVAPVRLLLYSEVGRVWARPVKAPGPCPRYPSPSRRGGVRAGPPPASVTQKLGVPHVALTDRDVLFGIDEPLAYVIRMMSAWQTCSLSRPG